MKVMYICTGNICRSPMAEGILKYKSTRNNLDIEVSSCGIYAQTGQIASRNSVIVMKEYGIDISDYKATNIHDSNIKEMDLIFCMTLGHKQAVIQIYPELTQKVYTLKEYIGETKDKDIKDPWGESLEEYRKVGEEIYYCIETFIEKI